MKVSAAGKNIKAFRQRHGITQTDFANAIGVSQTAVSAWETGATTPRASAIKQILNVFPNLDYDLLMSEEKGYSAMLLNGLRATNQSWDKLNKIWKMLKPEEQDSLLKIAAAFVAAQYKGEL